MGAGEAFPHFGPATSFPHKPTQYRCRLAAIVESMFSTPAPWSNLLADCRREYQWAG
jgi:hypothetical protein